MLLRAPSALPVLSVSVSHMSALYSARGVLDRPVQQSGILYHFQLLPAPPFLLSRNSFKLQETETHLFASDNFFLNFVISIIPLRDENIIGENLTFT